MRKFAALFLLPFIFYGCGLFDGSNKRTEFDRRWPRRGIMNAGSTKEGYALTKLNDTLKGFFQLKCCDEPSFSIPYLAYNKNKKKGIVNLSIDSIDYMRVSGQNWNRFSKSWALDTVNYVAIKSYLYEQLGRKGDVRIIYRHWTEHLTDEIVTNHEMLLVSPKDTATISYGSSSIDKWTLRQFINTRYHQNFDKKHFKNKQAQLDYILEKENEKLLAK